MVSLLLHPLPPPPPSRSRLDSFAGGVRQADQIFDITRDARGHQTLIVVALNYWFTLRRPVFCAGSAVAARRQFFCFLFWR